MENELFYDVADRLARKILKEGGHTIYERDVSCVAVSKLLCLVRDAIGPSYTFACEAVRDRLKSMGWENSCGIYFFRGVLSDYESLVVRGSVGE